ncbi:hypothetical protein NLM33_19015 [Bradyrhizobium sp. CCGUVB1N3]|uniref:hypothetical protein n=1 Tax=Bradyrhizobium sp. CCGUVB1N3 TaxID=2949629 RepID=UPI0020B1D0C6|nr:hypothetical protein [Bradyrhizobium sp. CCGUVB1N3]MCP3472406.1 hypothetical protein [Bradyrhizobium sp. CCGUVB1N3]
MEGLIEVGGDISAAATALAGLLLVFLGAIAVAFEGYQPQERNPIRGRYQRRAWLGFVGFVFAILAAATGIAGKAFHQECIALIGALCLVVALIMSLLVALFSALEIR